MHNDKKKLFSFIFHNLNFFVQKILYIINYYIIIKIFIKKLIKKFVKKK